MTLGTMSASSTNIRGNALLTIVPNTQAAMKRMSLAVAAPPVANTMSAVPGPSRRMSMGTALPPPARHDSVGVTTYVNIYTHN